MVWPRGVMVLRNNSGFLLLKQGFILRLILVNIQFVWRYMADIMPEQSKTDNIIVNKS